METAWQVLGTYDAKEPAMYTLLILVARAKAWASRLPNAGRPALKPVKADTGRRDRPARRR
jgi:hypothetical protein